MDKESIVKKDEKSILSSVLSVGTGIKTTLRKYVSFEASAVVLALAATTTVMLGGLTPLTLGVLITCALGIGVSGAIFND